MSTVSRGFPARPQLDVPRKQAHDLLAGVRAGLTDALDRVKRRHPQFQAADRDIISGIFKLSDAHFRSDPQLIHRRFSYKEIYPPLLGCADDSRSGLHGTPVAGTTLLHLSIDFDELEIFDWLLERGADVNAAAAIDEEGFGGHTPLYNAVVSQAYSTGRQRDAYMARRLLESGANIHMRVNLRKYLDWREEPGWYIARNVTPLDWAVAFPETGWVSREAVNLIENIRKG